MLFFKRNSHGVHWVEKTIQKDRFHCHRAVALGKFGHHSRHELKERGGGASSIVKVPGDVPPTRVYFSDF